jgi:hypothetical protein
MAFTYPEEDSDAQQRRLAVGRWRGRDVIR